MTLHFFGTAAGAFLILGVAGGCGRKEATPATEPIQLVDISQPEVIESPKPLIEESPKSLAPPQPVARPMPAPVKPAPVSDNEARELVNFVRPEAESGDAESQYLLGIFLVNGSGVPTDRVEALKWLLLAAAQNHKEAISARDLVTKLLTAQQRAEAEKRAKEFTPAKSAGAAKP